jgi:hypothetical protein
MKLAMTGTTLSVPVFTERPVGMNGDVAGRAAMTNNQRQRGRRHASTPLCTVS